MSRAARKKATLWQQKDFGIVQKSTLIWWVTGPLVPLCRVWFCFTYKRLSIGNNHYCGMYNCLVVWLVPIIVTQYYSCTIWSRNLLLPLWMTHVTFWCFINKDMIWSSLFSKFPSDGSAKTWTVTRASQFQKYTTRNIRINKNNNQL
jgi:hypothetical protein